MTMGHRGMTRTRRPLVAGALIGLTISLGAGACSSSAKTTAADTTVAPTTTAADGSASATSTTASGSGGGSGGAPSASAGSPASGAGSSGGGSTSGTGFTAYNGAVEKCPPKEPPIDTGKGRSDDAPFRPTPPTVYITLSWKVSGSSVTVYDAVDDVNGPYDSGLPASGTARFPRHCDGTAHTYFVVATVDGKKIVKSTTDPGS